VTVDRLDQEKPADRHTTWKEFRLVDRGLVGMNPRCTNKEKATQLMRLTYLAKRDEMAFPKAEMSNIEMADLEENAYWHTLHGCPEIEMMILG
jgi:hypothetical protein